MFSIEAGSLETLTGPWSYWLLNKRGLQILLQFNITGIERTGQELPCDISFLITLYFFSMDNTTEGGSLELLHQSELK